VGTILADINGYWQGEVGFAYSNASYHFSLHNFANSMSGYQSYMTQVSAAAEALGTEMQNNDLAANLIYWSSWVNTVTLFDDATGTYSDQTMSLNADPASIMNFLSVLGTISNVNYDCNIATSSTSFNPSLAQLSMVFDIPTMMADHTCSSILNPAQLGYSSIVTGNTFTINLDVRTLFTAMTVTLEVNGPNTLNGLTRLITVAQGTFYGVVYEAVDVFDSQVSF